MSRRSIAVGFALTLASLGLVATPAQAHHNSTSFSISVHSGGHHTPTHRHSSKCYYKRSHYGHAHNSHYKQGHYYRQDYHGKRYAHGHRKHRHDRYCPSYVYRSGHGDYHHRKARRVYHALKHLDHAVHGYHY